ncbi:MULTISPECIES: alanine--glyoxylate aminotransferase family protein [unclassified Pseudomonas]|uniref:pyridoxal-phosphate-dependent aminotransferase family protein n=1 Tax=unclassified Pseudomonas TaxID=196821 RepID=UPI000A1FE57A|nr:MULTISPECIES: aminotransferase class V-fold PLP-dependent enzyme [unclassified Pseudomonas]
MASTQGAADKRQVLMNPGPVTTQERVRLSLAGPDQCHREPEFAALMTAVRQKITQVSGGDDRYASVVLTGSGTAAVEATMASVIPDGGTVLIIDNGHYAERLHDIAKIHAIASVRLTLGWSVPVDKELIDRTLRENPGVTHVAVVHHETSTGMLNDIVGLAAIAHRHGCKMIVDAVSSLGAEPIDQSRDGIDWLIGSAGKCIEGMPGLSFVCALKADFASLKAHKARTFYLDLHRHFTAQETSNAPAFTPAVPLFYALDTALDLLMAEGVAERNSRYRRLATRLRDGLTRLGLSILLAPEHRAVGLTTVGLPEGVHYADLHPVLKSAGYVIYTAQEHLANRFFRLSTMGCMSAEDIDGFLETMAQFLSVRPVTHDR